MPDPLPGASAGASPGEAGGDRLAEAVALLTRIRRDGQWEAEQTHASLLPYLIEESWELVDAVAADDRDELVSELGDLLLQVLFHAAIGTERSQNAFDVQDVAGALLDKLRRRAPYWFADGDPNTNSEAAPGLLSAPEQDRVWQEAKAAERQAGDGAGRPQRGVVDGISWGMPALALGQKVLQRARSAGIPEDVIPEAMRLVRVSAEASAEVAYRQVVHEFADQIRRAESRMPTAPTSVAPTSAAPTSAAAWRAAWQ